MIGDLIGKPGRVALEALLPGLRHELGIDFVTANGENVAGGMGLTASTATFSPLAVTKSMPSSWRRPGRSASTATLPGLPMRSPIIRMRQTRRPPLSGLGEPPVAATDYLA